MVPHLGEAVAAALVAGALVTLLSGVVRSAATRGRRSGIGLASLDGALTASVVGVLLATLSPISLLGTTDLAPTMNLQPFELMVGAPVRFAVINVLLLVPTTFLLALRWQRAGALRLTMLAMTASVAVELAQLTHPLRGTNVDDVILNTAGAAAAAVLGVTVRAIARAQRRRAARATQPAREAYEAEVPVRAGGAPFENVS